MGLNFQLVCQLDGPVNNNGDKARFALIESDFEVVSSILHCFGLFGVNGKGIFSNGFLCLLAALEKSTAASNTGNLVLLVAVLCLPFLLFGMKARNG